MITEPVLTIERKNIDAYQVKNRLHTMIATNYEWAVAAARDARRYVVNDVSAAKQRQKPYFDALFAEVENGGLGAVLYDLVHTDLGDWRPAGSLRDRGVTGAEASVVSPQKKNG